jgi:hypothetical protein
MLAQSGPAPRCYGLNIRRPSAVTSVLTSWSLRGAPRGSVLAYRAGCLARASR